jgi:hypothetical protein
MNYLLKRVALPMIVSFGILLVYAPTAEAHKINYRPLVTNDYYYARDRAYAMPHWVRKDRDFRRWFLHSRYRYARRQNWSMLYDLYTYERRTYRHRHRYHQVNGKYREHVVTPRRHKH